MWLMLALLSIIPQTEAVHDHVPQLEINRYYDDHANHVFTQNIYRDADGTIIAWHLSKSTDHKPIAQRVTFYDGHMLRDIRCDRVVETYTQVDPELCEWSELPIERRRGLSRPINHTER